MSACLSREVANGFELLSLPKGHSTGHVIRNASSLMRFLYFNMKAKRKRIQSCAFSTSRRAHSYSLSDICWQNSFALTDRISASGPSATLKSTTIRVIKFSGDVTHDPCYDAV